MDRHEQGQPQTPNRASRRLARRGHRPDSIETRLRDVGLGVTAGLAALGLAAGVWTGAYAEPDQVALSVASTATACCHGSAAATAMMTINVRASGSVRAILGGGQAQIAVPQGSTVTGLGEILAEQYPQLAPSAMLAVAGGGEMLAPYHVLADGDTVEIIPPMAGG